MYISNTATLPNEIIYKVIPNFPLYSISNIGQIISNIDNEDMFDKYIWKHNRFQICLKKDFGQTSNQYVDRLVAETFIDLPNNNNSVNQYIVRHYDFDNYNNIVDNLFWFSKSDRRKELKEIKIKLLEEKVIFLENNPDYVL